MKGIKIEWLIYAEPNKVFDALTNAEVISQWSGESAMIELKEGGDLEMFDGWVKGEVIDFDKDKLLSYTWKPSEWGKKVKASRVTYNLVSDSAGTKIILEHVDFPSEKIAKDHEDGWVNHVFDPLNDYFISQKTDSR